MPKLIATRRPLIEPDAVHIYPAAVLVPELPLGEEVSRRRLRL